MKPTENLKNEHQAIKLMLTILEEVGKKIESGKEIDPEHLEKILDFIRVFADKCHHGKEEDLLFPAMEEAGIPREGGPIGVMLMEHTMGRDFVKAMGEAARKYEKGDRKASSQFVENARKYTSLLSQHIDKEDNILYPMAERRLSEEKQGELLRDFDRIEREIIGPGKHEEFHRLLELLKKIYLKGS